MVKRGVLEFGHEFVGIENGYQGLIEPELDAARSPRKHTRGILPKGGTILGTSNKANPFAVRVKEDGKWVERDHSRRGARSATAELKLDGLIAIGGDGTLTIAHELRRAGLQVVGCPKTIDNDLVGHRSDLRLRHRASSSSPRRSTGCTPPPSRTTA